MASFSLSVCGAHWSYDPVAGGVGISFLVARMVACNIIVFGSVPCCANVGAGADVGADADADDGDGDGDAFSPNVDGECAVHVSVFDADTGPVEVDACLQYQCRWRMCCARVWI